MIQHRTLASAMLAAFGAIGLGGTSAAAASETVGAPPTEATVVSLSLVPASSRAQVVIRVDGNVTYKHFTLSKPDKIVLDLSNASLDGSLPSGDSYDGVARGGITRVRYSQFTKSVVRVVLTLDAAHTYDVTQANGEIRVSVDGGRSGFEPWKAGASSEPLARVTPEPVREVAAKSTPVESTVPAPVAKPAERHLAFRDAEIRELPTPNAAPKMQSQEPRITGISWEDAPINDVISMFASFTGRTILASKAVTGRVTASITNLPWDVALKEIMNANGYDVTINPDGVIAIDTFENIAARQSTIPLQTKNLRLNYARSKSVAPMVAERLTRTCPATPSMPSASPLVQPAPGAPTAQPVPQVGIVQSLSCPARGTVTADTLTNSISITDVPSALGDLVKYAQSLDLRQPQVSIKAKIILVDRTTLEGLGLRYDLGSRQQFFNDIIPRLDSTGKARTDPGQVVLGGNMVSSIANATARIPSAALQLIFSTAMGNYDFSTFLEALQTNTLLDVQAEPQATVLNNRTASLTAGTQVPIRVIDQAAGGNATGNFPRATVQIQQTGVILTVTPQITANRQIQMRLHVENSDVQFQSNDVGAVFPTQKVDNEVLVADGETAVMGGLTQTSVNMTKTGIPILVDLPIIGRLFGVTNRTETKRDLLILITPHIIDDGQPPESPRQ